MVYSPDRIYRGEGGVDADIELVTVNQHGLVNVLLHKAALALQVQHAKTLKMYSIMFCNLFLVEFYPYKVWTKTNFGIPCKKDSIFNIHNSQKLDLKPSAPPPPNNNT